MSETKVTLIDSSPRVVTIFRGEKGDPGIVTETRVLSYESSGFYTLANPPPNTSSIMLFINGAKQSQGIDFNVNGAILHWVSSSLNLSNADLIEVIY